MATIRDSPPRTLILVFLLRLFNPSIWRLVKSAKGAFWTRLAQCTPLLYVYIIPTPLRSKLYYYFFFFTTSLFYILIYSFRDLARITTFSWPVFSPNLFFFFLFLALAFMMVASDITASHNCITAARKFYMHVLQLFFSIF